jgi:molybdopterin synthase catalytic subunit
MRRELSITTDKIDEAALVQHRELAGDMGAVISFVGVVRGLEEGRPIDAIDYEAFASMASHQFELIFDQVEKRWRVASVRLVHRVGRVAAGEPSLWVEVMAPHREEAFAACQFIIAEMKRLVPIWKKPCPA